MNGSFSPRLCRLGAAGLLLTLAGGCDTLRPTATPPPSLYSLDSARMDPGAPTRAASPRSETGPTLIVNPPHAASGFDSQRMIYVRQAHKLEYFAHNEWVDTPARMVAPLVVAAVEKSGAFRAVVLTPSAAAGDLRLDAEIVRLQHDFGSQPSRVQFTLRAYLVDNATRRVLAWREFDETVAAASEDPYGGVVAANRAVRTVLEQLAGFCAEAARDWDRPHKPFSSAR
jgi:cholesterol transport system auxiliary component